MDRRTILKGISMIPMSYVVSEKSTASSLSHNESVLFFERSGIYIEPNIGIDISKHLQTAIDDTSGKVIFLGSGEYIIENPVYIKNDSSIIGCGFQTKIISRVPDNQGTFITRKDQWPFRARINNIHLIGNNKNNYGILSGDTTISKDSNAPFMMLENVLVSNFKVGIYLEGYGHHLTLCYATNCIEGYKIYHPEQVIMLNCWAEYCNYGLTVNNPDINKSMNYGHMFKVIGGAYQRNQIGIRLWKTFDPSIDTYSEGNAINDIVLGENKVVNYDKSVHTAFLKLVTASRPSDCCIRLNATDAASIDFIRASPQKNEKTYIISDGWSKNIIIRYPPTKILSTVPFLFNGDSAKTSLAIPYGSNEARI